MATALSSLDVVKDESNKAQADNGAGLQGFAAPPAALMEAVMPIH